MATYGRVVELVDSLDSGSSVHCGRAGSSPASPTKETVERLSLFLLAGDGFPVPILAKTAKAPGFPMTLEIKGLFCYLCVCSFSFQLFTPISVVLVDASPPTDKIRVKICLLEPESCQDRGSSFVSLHS